MKDVVVDDVGPQSAEYDAQISSKRLQPTGFDEEMDDISLSVFDLPSVSQELEDEAADVSVLHCLEVLVNKLCI